MYTESDSCDYSVVHVGIFPRKEIFWKTLHFCVHCEGKILLTLFGNHIFLATEKKKNSFSHQFAPAYKGTLEPCNGYKAEDGSFFLQKRPQFMSQVLYQLLSRILLTRFSLEDCQTTSVKIR